MEKKISEGTNNNEGDWTLNISNEKMKVWTRWSGTEFDSNQPCIKVEHYFPEIQEPNLIRLAYNEFRPDWDTKIKEIEELQ